MKVMTILGTRPEIIRLSAVIARLDATEAIDHVLVHTGQNYDYELNELFFEELRVRAPDHFLNVDTTSLGRVYGDVLAKSEEIMLSESPDAVLILGDTNSAVAAMMARRMAIPIFHMEAGNRCFDWRVPEEMNRRLVDHISNYNLVYTEHARRNLLAEGIAANSIVKTGSPMNEVLRSNRTQIDQSTVLVDLGLEPGNYYLASLHRQENVDDETSCRELFEGLHEVSARDCIPAIVSVHPRTRKRLASFGIVEGDGLRFLRPFGFHDYNRLQLDARCVISDSGTISEEAALLGFPAVSPRTATERPEGVDAGVFHRCDRTREAILRGVSITTAPGRATPATPPDYLIENTSDIVVNAISSLA